MYVCTLFRYRRHRAAWRFAPTGTEGAKPSWAEFSSHRTKFWHEVEGRKNDELETRETCWGIFCLAILSSCVISLFRKHWIHHVVQHGLKIR